MSIKAFWESYRERAMPVDASIIQLQECQKAFYFGAAVALAMMISIGQQGDECKGEEIMENALREINLFQEQVGRES